VGLTEAHARISCVRYGTDGGVELGFIKALGQQQQGSGTCHVTIFVPGLLQPGAVHEGDNRFLQAA